MIANSLLKGLVGAAFLLGATLAANAADTLGAVKAAGTLKVGTETAFALLDFIDAGEHAGLNVDIFAEIGKELGVKIEWVALPWDGVFPALEAGKFDVVAGPATITKKRMERYRFTPPIAEATIAVLKKAGDTSISSRNSLKRCRPRSTFASIPLLPNPTPIWRRVVSRVLPTRCRTLRSSPSSARALSKSSCLPSARSPISVSSA